VRQQLPSPLVRSRERKDHEVNWLRGNAWRGRRPDFLIRLRFALHCPDDSGLPDLKTRKVHPMPKAVWNGTVIAESDATVRLEGNHYFPPDAIHE
jgi:hypothetical protein